MQPLFPGFSKEGGKGRRVESRTVAAGMIVILVTIVLTVSHGHWRFFRLNWSNPLQISSGDDRQATFEGQSSQPENSGDTLTQIRVEGPSGNYKVSDTHEQNQGVTGQGARVSKPLKDLVNDPSDYLSEICRRLDTPFTGVGNYEEVAKYYSFDVYTIRIFKECQGGPSNALISAIIAKYPKVTVKMLAAVIAKQASRGDVAELLMAFDRK
ncbi:PREDICTED: uncharacterized protein LOC107340069 isoform X2 [Acropora digitifera]|uniref:uncharacterized protein LOC107340069 isoform X2 n=1 Tax=Acropora digitifera TaxID=70779 RepID=UPI00077AF6E5|nr:PREDICTED: uncharacterized protein LOC107340069 isoform X2 [Acropora digitifera]